MISLSIVHQGLSASPKFLNHGFLYHGNSGEHFEKAISHENYYIVHGDVDNVEQAAKDMSTQVGKGAQFIDFGCGNCKKSLPFLREFDQPSYLATDIDPIVLSKVKARIHQALPEIPITTISVDFSHPFTLPPHNARRVGLLAGNMAGSYAIEGNINRTHPLEQVSQFVRADCQNMIKHCVESMGKDGALLFSFDMNTDPRTNFLPYNTTEYGVFVKNALPHLNERFGADFDLEQFEHKLQWNASEQIVEQCVIPKSCQSVKIDGRQYIFEEGEKTIVFPSYKRSKDDVERIVAGIDCHVKKTFDDKNGFMCLAWIEKNK